MYGCWLGPLGGFSQGCRSYSDGTGSKGVKAWASGWLEPFVMCGAPGHVGDTISVLFEGLGMEVWASWWLKPVVCLGESWMCVGPHLSIDVVWFGDVGCRGRLEPWWVHGVFVEVKLEVYACCATLFLESIG